MEDENLAGTGDGFVTAVPGVSVEANLNATDARLIVSAGVVEMSFI